jgi:integrase
MEAIRLRVKDLDFARGEVSVREGKGAKDRVTMLPASIVPPLQAHLNNVRMTGRPGHFQTDLPRSLQRVARHGLLK